MRIGILTGGGDVPGLNPAIKAVVNQADELGWQVVGFRRGWAGPLTFNPGRRRRRPVDAHHAARPGSRAHDRPVGRHHPPYLADQSRQGETRSAARFSRRPQAGRRTGLVDCTDHVIRVLEHLGIDALVPIGGDDTLSYAARLHDEGVPVMSIPKTMDNDVLRHRLLHRLFDRGQPQRRVHPCPPHADRQPRAHRGDRAVRPQLRRDGADLRLSRRVPTAR